MGGSGSFHTELKLPTASDGTRLIILRHTYREKRSLCREFGLEGLESSSTPFFTVSVSFLHKMNFVRTEVSNTSTLRNFGPENCRDSFTRGRTLLLCGNSERASNLSSKIFLEIFELLWQSANG